MMRVCFVTSGLGAGGAENALLRLAPALRDFDIEPAVVSLRDVGPIGALLRAKGIPVAALGLPSISGLALALPRLAASLRELRPDVLQGWMYHGNLAATLGARLPAAPNALFWSVRQTLATAQLDKTLTRWVNGLSARLSSLPRHVIYCAATARADHERAGYSPERGVVIPNGFDTQRWRPDAERRAAMRRELDIPDDAPVVGHVARLHPAKDHDTMLRAAADVARRIPRAIFVLAGEGTGPDSPYITRLVDAAGLRSNVRLLGYRDDLENVIPGFDVACLSSRAEALPNAVGEAMSCGVPCAATDVGDVRELIDETGRIVPPREPTALAEAIVALLSMSAEARKSLGDAARRRIEQRYSVQHAAAAFAALYREETAGTRAGGN